MARLGIGRVHISWAVPWSRRPIIFKQGAPWTGNAAALSVPQLKACLALAEEATSAYGTMGKLSYKGVSMPAVAVKVAEGVAKGPKVHGGMTRRERAEQSHRLAGARIAALRSLIAAKGG